MHASINDISSAIIGAAIEVHRFLGPGLLESAYEQSLAHEFSLRQIPFERQKPLALIYKGMQLDCSFPLDFLVADSVVVEIKAIDALLPIHQAQLLSYLKLGGWKLGLLINFHVPLLRDGGFAQKVGCRIPSAVGAVYDRPEFSNLRDRGRSQTAPTAEDDRLFVQSP
jgi:GxxExxY protein